jgi:hypothetical protein
VIIFLIIFLIIIFIIAIEFLEPIICYYLKGWPPVPCKWASEYARLSHWGSAVKCLALPSSVFPQGIRMACASAHAIIGLIFPIIAIIVLCISLAQLTRCRSRNNGYEEQG